jgi:hypothetical protein
MAFTFQQYGTFTGTGTQFLFRDNDDFTNTFQDPTFNIPDVAMVLLNTQSDYVYLHLNGSSTGNVTLEKNSGPIPSFEVKATNTTFTGSVVITANCQVNGLLTVSGTNVIAEINVAKALPAKPFDIPHPSKLDTHRLRYVSLEGPEIAVYFRGKLKDENIINLPEYWKDLVDYKSISVNLTPYGEYQELYVEYINEQQIKVKNRENTSINCYFTVYAERKDMEKLIVEYEGSSPKDYPGQDWLNLG